jgi:uncharacterized protein YuzE
MSNQPRVRIVVDQDAGAAYMTLTDRPVARTVEAADDIYVDLDEFDMVVGIELLTHHGAQLPITDLAHSYHLPSGQLEIIRAKVTEMTQFISGSTSVKQQRGVVSRSTDIQLA